MLPILINIYLFSYIMNVSGAQKILQVAKIQNKYSRVGHILDPRIEFLTNPMINCGL